MKRNILSFAMLAAALVYANSISGLENRAVIPENLKKLLQLSLRAPSSHNAQMWKICYRGDMRIGIMLDESRLLRETDPKNREAYMSIGALIENIISVSGEFSLSAEILKTEESGMITEIKFTPCSKQDTGISELLKKRGTIRSKFRKNEIRENDLKQILSYSSGSLYFYPRKSTEGNYIRNKTIEAAVLQTDNDRKQKELSEWMRFSKKERNSSPDGITPEMMGFRGLMKNIIYLFFNEKTAMKKSFRNKTEGVFKKQLDNCAGFTVITSRDDSEESLIKAGRLMQRFWLKCTGMNIAVHPMNQAVQERMIDISSLRRTADDEKVQLILRTGYVKKYPEPSSRRISIDDIIVYR